MRPLQKDRHAVTRSAFPTRAARAAHAAPRRPRPCIAGGVGARAGPDGRPHFTRPRCLCIVHQEHPAPRTGRRRLTGQPLGKRLGHRSAVDLCRPGRRLGDLARRHQLGRRLRDQLRTAGLERRDPLAARGQSAHQRRRPAAAHQRHSRQHQRALRAHVRQQARQRQLRLFDLRAQRVRHERRGRPAGAGAEHRKRQGGDGVLDREGPAGRLRPAQAGRLPGAERHRRQRRHALVVEVCRQRMDPGRPGPVDRHRRRRIRLAGRLRPRLRPPGIGRRHEFQDRLPHAGGSGRARPRAGVRHRPLRAHAGHRPRAHLRLLDVRVQGLPVARRRRQAGLHHSDRADAVARRRRQG
jgi:hypothetical protein